LPNPPKVNAVAVASGQPPKKADPAGRKASGQPPKRADPAIAKKGTALVPRKVGLVIVAFRVALVAQAVLVAS
jgi:hypothetical protein